jgi:uncharacterized protein (DUF608 family)
MTIDGLTHSGIPLGGLGTGSVELRRDGYFHEWQIANNTPWGAGPDLEPPADAGFFAVQALGAGHCRSAVLGLTPPYNSVLNNPYNQPVVEHAASIDADVQMPFTTLRYALPRGFGLGVEMEASSPLIPLDEKHSALPVGFFRFTVTNRTSAPLTAAIVHAQRNLAGYTHDQNLSRMAFSRRGRSAHIRMTRDDMPKGASADGSLVIGAFGAGSSSYALHPRTDRDLWEPLRSDGRLDNTDHGPFSGDVGNQGEGRRDWIQRGTPHGYLCRTLRLKPRETAEVVFCLAWYFPHMWERDYAARDRRAERIGHRYAEWFSDATDVFDYASRRYDKLRRRTRAFSDAFHNSSLERWKLDAISAQLTTLIKSSWWDARGRFGIWEGLGCCGLQTTDITHYGSFPIALMFPEIQKSQMRLTAANVETPGKIPHMMPGIFSCGDADTRGRIDLIPQFVLLIWRDALWTGDLDYAREMWPVVTAALEFCRSFDTDGDGLPNNTGPDQTYDQFPLKGTSSFVGFLYAGALSAGGELARLLGETGEADRLTTMASDALDKLEQQLWTGRYYRLCHDPSDGMDNDGVMADQVNADWFYRQTTGRPLLPRAKVRSALREILRHCTNRQHGFLANCAWPTGDEVHIGRHTSDQANTPWSGVEYALAAHCILAGLDKRGWEVTKRVWGRHERVGLRFNHIECGEHYYRAMSSWAIYLAWTGFAWDAPAATLTLRAGAPRRFVVNTPTSWSVAEVGARKPLLELKVAEGTLALRTLRLTDLRADRVRVTVPGRDVACDVESSKDALTVRLKRLVRLRPGDTLRIVAN